MTIDVGLLISIFALLFVALGYGLNKNKAIKSDGQESAELKAGLDYIRKGVDDIRIDFKANEKRVGELEKEVVRIGESSKQAHKRIDGLEKEMN